ncbi:MAG: PEP-CTERM sorting domain-containing protein [Candidatus Nitrotoga sp.]
MNNILKLLKFAAAIFLTYGMMPLSVQASPIYQIDTLLGSTELASSGDAAELAWMKLVTGDTSLMLNFKISTSLVVVDNDTAVANNLPSNSWYIDVAPSTPGFFLLKFGNSTQTDNTHYAFANISDFTKLVFSNAQVDGITGNSPSCGGPCNIGKLSHYAGFSADGGGPPSQVPEPGSMLLLGIGLSGLAWMRRRGTIV